MNLTPMLAEMEKNTRGDVVLCCANDIAVHRVRTLSILPNKSIAVIRCTVHVLHQQHVQATSSLNRNSTAGKMTQRNGAHALERTLSGMYTGVAPVQPRHEHRNKRTSIMMGQKNIYVFQQQNISNHMFNQP